MNAWSGSTIPIPADRAEAREDCGPRVRKAMEQFPSYSGEMPPQEARRAGKSVCGAKWAKWGDLGFDHETWNPKKLYKQMPVLTKKRIEPLNFWKESHWFNPLFESFCGDHLPGNMGIWAARAASCCVFSGESRDHQRRFSTGSKNKARNIGLAV